VAELQASEEGLKKLRDEFEAKLEQLEDLLASTTSTRDELQGTVCQYVPVEHTGLDRMPARTAGWRLVSTAV
jgi:hypothetical protein